MTYYYKNYEWTAFRESDLLQSGDTNLGCGDKFVMPSSATVCMSTWDNDGSLSGDDCWDDRAADSSGQDAWVNGARVGCQMYAEQYHVLKGSDGKTYYLIEIEVEGYDAPGAGEDFFTFYGAKPPAGVTLTVVSSCNVSGCMIDYSCLGAGAKAPPNTPPTFTNVPGDGVFCVAENTKLVIDLAATDKDGDALTYSIAGGNDAAFFEVDPTTGILSFKAPPDYETPADKDGNNAYQVNVKVSDGKGGEEIKCLTVNVCDVPEGGTKCIVIEAEDMRLCNYKVECRDAASGDANIVLACAGGTGTASTTFSGPAGVYDMTITYMDENDGNGAIEVYVNGAKVKTVRLDKNDDGNGNACSTFSDITLQDLNLKAGDVITLKGIGSCYEGVRIDKITLCNDTPAPQPGALEGRLFQDLNDDSVDNSEPGVGGVTVTLYAADGTTVVATTTTAADGSYYFGNLAAGNYIVGFPTSVNGKVLVDANAGADDTVDSDASTATGKTGLNTVVAGATTKDVDAGIEDPRTGALGDRVWIDTDNDGQQDAGEAGKSGVSVTLLSAMDVVLATTTTDADGDYLFSGLAAGDYKVLFGTADDFIFTTANTGDDGTDSDADQTSGETGVITLAIGETNLTVDAGLVAENDAPEPQNDTAGTCVTNPVTVDALANDKDEDGDALTITHVNGIAISDESPVNINGVTVSLVSGKLVFDGSASAELVALNVGDQKTISYTYTVKDGVLSADATIDVKWCGSAETITELYASLPTSASYQVRTDDIALPVDGTSYDIKITGTGDARFDGVIFERAYCLSYYDPAITTEDFATTPANTAKVLAGTNTSVFSPTQIGIANGQTAAQNLDLINWLIAQDFVGANTNAVDGQITDWEVQRAIWELTDNLNTDFLSGISSGFGNNADVDWLLAQARANGEDYTPGMSGLVTLILDPNPPTSTNSQPFIIAFNAADYDCLCG